MITAMAMLTISEVAREMGLRPSAIRYYEQIGLLPAPERIGGQRRYDQTVLHRLALVQRARATGFTLEELRRLFFGFQPGTTASKRWHQLSCKKLSQLDEQRRHIKTMQALLRQMMKCCRCETLEQCGAGIYRKEKKLLGR